jgi:membrane associated rhomboid family serine protease
MRNGSIWEDIKWRYRYGGILTRLIMINITVFVLVKLLILIADWGMGTGIGSLVFEQLTISSEPRMLLKKPWSVVTHMFLHKDLFHILFNMLILYWFGLIFREYIGESRILPVYVMGSIFGVSIYMILYNVLPVFANSISMAWGASVGVMAVVVAIATIVPNYSMNLLFFGPVQIKWIAAVMIALDMLTIPDGNSGGHIAHLGGALFGFIYATQYRSGNDLSRPFYTAWDAVRNFFDFSSKPKKKRVRKSRVRMAFRNEENARSGRRPAVSNADDSGDKQEKIDEILDKISRSGYESLTKEEKAFLFKVSKE